MDISATVHGPFVLGLSKEERVNTYLSVKYACDKIVAAVLLVALAPLMILVALLVKLSSKGPAIFKQERLTDNSRVFTMYKFRTMRMDAEKNSGAVWAKENDSRVTRLGAFLRKSRLDELPQLVNVLNGEMSLIGPRPERPEIASELIQEIPDFRHRTKQRAGITGLAQVRSGYAACNSSYRRKVALDKFYVENCSAALDIRIAFQTVGVILSGFGAR